MTFTPSSILAYMHMHMLVRHYEAFVTAVFPRGVCPSNQEYYLDGYCDVYFTEDGMVYIYPVKVTRHDPPSPPHTIRSTAVMTPLHQHPRPHPLRWLLAGLTRTTKARAAQRTAWRRKTCTTWTGGQRMHSLPRAA